MSSDGRVIPLNRPLAGLRAVAAVGGPSVPAARQAELLAREQQLARVAGDLAEKEKCLDAMLRQVGGLIQGLEQAKLDLLRENEREIISLSLTVAEKVIQHEIAQGGYCIGEIVRAALEAVHARGAVTVKVNPADRDAVETALRKADPARPPSEEEAVTVVADPAVPRAGCAVESAAGSAFTEAASRLDLIRKGLLNHAAEPVETGDPDPDTDAPVPADATDPGGDHGD